MRRIGDTAFFRDLDQVLGPSLRDTQANAWTIDGVRWVRQRHSHGGPAYSFVTEAVTGESLAGTPWSVLVVKEYWWKGSGRSELRSGQWATLLSGRREQLVAWLERARDANA
jgi:hypothetical protein